MHEIFKRTDLSVKWYDRIYPRNLIGTTAAGDVEFYLRQAHQTGGPVLELGCGTGRIALALAESGFDVTGLDLSSPALEVAARKIPLARTRGRIKLVRGNMTKFRLKRKFPLAIIPFRAFQHLLSPTDQRSCLKSVFRHLKPSGKLIVDLFDPRLDMCVPGERSTKGEGNVYTDPESQKRLTVKVLEGKNDPLHQILREIWEFTLRDRRGKQLDRSCVTVTLRWTYRWEMRYLLELCGFKPLACYGDFQSGSARYGMEQVWVAQRKRA